MQLLYLRVEEDSTPGAVNMRNNNVIIFQGMFVFSPYNKTKYLLILGVNISHTHAVRRHQIQNS